MATRDTRSAGGVVLNADNQVLVVSQRGDSWSLPKGHIEADEDTLAAAKREVYEETGISNLDLVCELGEYTRFRIAKGGGEDTSERKTMTFYLFKTDQMTLAPIDADHPEARWVAPGNVADLLTHPKDQAFFNSILEVIASHAQ